ncbi:phage head morphogenesis protein, partial [Clostridiaceae bacterium]|nr:phage head morphogenesis protein [Clostridiaceae bacterium]
MNNREYWRQRFIQLEAAQNRKAAAVCPEIERQYKQAQKEIEGKISAWYQRLAANNGVSMAEARKMLSGSDLKEFKWDVRDYIRYGKENALTGGWVKELENASAKFHISRLEALKIETQ